MLSNLSQSQPYVKNVLLVSAGYTLKTQCGDSEICRICFIAQHGKWYAELCLSGLSIPP